MTTLWASDTNFADPGKGWDATPTKVAPSSGQITQGFLPEEMPPAQHINWAIATAGGRISASSDEFTYTTPKSRSKRVNLHWAKAYNNWVIGQGAASWSVASCSNDKIDIPLGYFAPSGCTITSVAIKVVSGAAGRTGANRMQLSLWKSSATGGATQIGSTADDGGSSGSIQITISSLTEVVDLTSNEYFVTVKSGGTGAANEVLSSLLVTFTDIGPRNG